MSQIAEAFVRVRAVADTRSFEQSTQRALKGNEQMNRSLRDSEREFGRFGRGALVGTGALSGLGRAAAFASTSFIGGAGLIYALKASVQQATEQQTVLANLKNSLEASGFSWNTYGQQIQEATQHTKELSAFDDEELFKSLQLLVRGTGNVTKALDLNALAADVARGRNLGLVQAAQLLVRVQAGQIGSLRRLGINVKEGISGTQALIEVQKQYAGAAAAFGDTAEGAQQRFNVAIQDTEKLIGRALLPTLTKYLKKATDWLNDTENQKKLQKDLDDAVAISTTVLGGLATAIGKVHTAYVNLRNLPGGDRGLIDILPAGHFTLLDLLDSINAKLGLTKKAADDARVAVGAFVHDIGQGGFGSTRSPLLPNQEVTFPRRFPDPFADAKPNPNATAAALARTRAATRDERTATALAKAQAEGTKAQIIAASKARLAFVTDTIAFAKKLLSEGRGNTKKLQATLVSAYSEERSDQAIIDQINQDAADAAAKRAKDAKDKADAQAKKLKEIAAANLKSATERVAAINQAAVAQTYAITRIGERLRKELKDRAAQAKIHAANLKDTQDQIALQIIENNLAAARLIPNTEKELAAEKKAQLVLVEWYKRRAKQLGLNTLAGQQAQGDYLNALQTYRNLGKKEKSATFTLAQLFSEADKEFATFGSNIGAAGTPLSPQEARGAFAGTVKSHQTTVVQNFYGERPTGQALADARAVARNSK